MGVSTGCVSPCPNWSTTQSINAVWDKEIVLVSRSTAIPRANFMGPRSEMSHFALSCSQKWMFSSRGLAIEKILSTCTAKMTLPVGEWWT